MPKPSLKPEFSKIEALLIDTFIKGLHGRPMELTGIPGWDGY